MRVCVFALKGNEYIQVIKTPENSRAANQSFANPDYFNETQQQQRDAKTSPIQYLNVGRR